MITAETMRRIAPKQGEMFAESLLNCTADVLDAYGFDFTLRCLEHDATTAKSKSARRIFAQLLQVMRSPEVIDEWTPFGGEP